TRTVGDIGTAEELAQDALVAALEQWPTSGVPERPGAWLMGTAKHHATDLVRRRKTLEHKYEELGRDTERDQQVEDPDAAIDEDVGDDLLGLIFMACHPVLSKDARVALTLRVLGGLTTEEIARGFLVPVSSMAQRIVRAKRTLDEAHVRFEIPRGPERVARLASVLEVIYLIFNEGYSATAGTDWVRPALCEEALRLGRILAELVPTEPEVHGLVALMEIHASRLDARVGPSGEPILLLDQDRAIWDHLLIRRGLAALERAERLGGPMRPYALQAAVAACRGRAQTPRETGRRMRRRGDDWLDQPSVGGAPPQRAAFADRVIERHSRDVTGSGVAAFYKGWQLANEELIRVVEPLSPAQLQLPVGSPTWPIWASVSHLAGTRVYWLCHVFEEPGAETTPFVDPTGVGWEDEPDHPRRAD